VRRCRDGGVHRGGKAANVGFDGIECGDADQGLGAAGVFTWIS
jgi:hypothetical protein